MSNDMKSIMQEMKQLNFRLALAREERLKSIEITESTGHKLVEASPYDPTSYLAVTVHGSTDELHALLRPKLDKIPLKWRNRKRILEALTIENHYTVLHAAYDYCREDMIREILNLLRDHRRILQYICNRQPILAPRVPNGDPSAALVRCLDLLLPYCDPMICNVDGFNALHVLCAHHSPWAEVAINHLTGYGRDTVLVNSRVQSPLYEEDEEEEDSDSDGDTDSDDEDEDDEDEDDEDDEEDEEDDEEDEEDASMFLGGTALHLAAAAGMIDRVNYLIALGIDVNLVDDNGNTALHLAEEPDLQTLLINAGADPRRHNRQGKTAKLQNK